jgi:hypothetical protein
MVMFGLGPMDPEDKLCLGDPACGKFSTIKYILSVLVQQIPIGDRSNR